MKKAITAVLILLTLTMGVGCQQKEEAKTTVEEAAVTTKAAVSTTFENKFPEFIAGETETTVSFYKEDDVITVNKNPKKVVVLQNSMLDLWYLVGGTAIGRVDGDTNVPEEALNLPIVGKTSEVNIENLIAMEPDLVLLSTAFSAQMELIPLLEENNIPYAPITANMTPYQEFNQNMYLFSKIIGNESAYTNVATKIDEDIKAICEKTKKVEKQPTAVILFSSAKSVKCELPNSLTGEMMDMLGAQNIVADATIEGENKVDFSMEKLIEKNPDYILITTMGDIEKCKARVEEDIVANEAWASLTAVKEGRIYYLPNELFMYKPNARYGEAFKSLAEILYPEVF